MAQVNASALECTRAIEGPTVVANGATLIFEETGKLAGTLTNEGLVILRGVFGGARSGAGDFRIECSGMVKQPVVRDGIQSYDGRRLPAHCPDDV